MRLAVIVLALAVAGCGATSADLAQSGAMLEGMSRGMQQQPVQVTPVQQPSTKTYTQCRQVGAMTQCYSMPMR